MARARNVRALPAAAECRHCIFAGSSRIGPAVPVAPCLRYCALGRAHVGRVTARESPPSWSPIAPGGCKAYHAGPHAQMTPGSWPVVDWKDGTSSAIGHDVIDECGHAHHGAIVDGRAVVRDDSSCLRQPIVTIVATARAIADFDRRHVGPQSPNSALRQTRTKRGPRRWALAATTTRRDRRLAPPALPAAARPPNAAAMGLCPCRAQLRGH